MTRHFVFAVCVAGAAIPLASRSAGPAECNVASVPASPIVPLAPLGALKVGVALGSGSTHGMAHIGVIQALEARGVEVHVIAGTSVGAIVGGLWASGYSGR